jgi:hypothetical protein
MSRPLRRIRLVTPIAALLWLLVAAEDSPPPFRHYLAYRSPAPLLIDGLLNEAAWRTARWSEAFVDIEGAERPAPGQRTRFKLLWDDTNLYVGAELEESHVWATLTQRDAVIYRDNDFEVFIDPDGDTHNYYELEINALGTVWDLMLTRPYRDRGSAVTEWDIEGLRAAVSVAGTVNDPSDQDDGWQVELAIPWSALTEHAPGNRPPIDGDHWRVNFSRVQWRLEMDGGVYRKAIDPATEKPFPENNWVWSPQGAINMHMPERWGIVQFSGILVGEGTATFSTPADEHIRWALRELYYAQRAFLREYDRYASDLAALGLEGVLENGTPFRPELMTTVDGYEATAPGSDDTVWHIRQDGRIWRTKPGG